VRGNKEREKHIKKQLKGTDLNYEFILEGNIEDIEEETLSTYFAGDMKEVAPATSCALKHITAYERVVEQDVPFALILEDDIELLPEFNRILTKSLSEIKQNNLRNILVSYEDSNLKYVEGSIRKPNKVLYKKEKGRLAGAYGVDKAAAEAIVEYIKKNKCDQTIDWFHNKCAAEGLFDIYWAHPAIARQGSKAGEISSLIGRREDGLVRKISFELQKIYKKILYYFR